MAGRRRGFAPLWVYLFGLFTVAATQRLAFPPAEHGVAFNVTFFFGAAAAVVAILTLLERRAR
jgi:hypothetical protein